MTENFGRHHTIVNYDKKRDTFSLFCTTQLGKKLLEKESQMNLQLLGMWSELQSTEITEHDGYTLTEWLDDVEDWCRAVSYSSQDRTKWNQIIRESIKLHEPMVYDDDDVRLNGSRWLLVTRISCTALNRRSLPQIGTTNCDNSLQVWYSSV